MSQEIVYHELNNVAHTKHLAQDVANFIKENKLFSNIQGKAYVNVEGWQYAGTRLGFVPVLKSIVDLSDPDKDKHYKYSAWMELIHLSEGRVIGGGYATCCNNEKGKHHYDEYAICSMAQTRAVGKAYRNFLAWIIRAAGYEPTPLEEMESVKFDDIPPGKKPRAIIKNAPAEKEAPKPRERAGEASPEAKQLAADKIASVKQKTELLLLLNNKVITNEEKNKMIESINKLSSDRINAAIEKLKKQIQERQPQPQG